MGDQDVLSSEVVGNLDCTTGDGMITNDNRSQKQDQFQNSEKPEQNGSELAVSVDSFLQEESNSIAGSTTGRQPNGPKKTIRERYHSVKQQYPELIKRLNRHRAQTPNSFEWLGGTKNPLVLNAAQTPIANVLRSEKNSTPKETWEAGRPALPLDVSAVEPPPNRLNHSFTFPEDLNLERQALRGLANESVDEDFVNSKRRMRRVHAPDYLERVPSRGARSEIGEVGPYGGQSFYRMHPMQSHFYDPRSYYSAYRDYAEGRRSVGLTHQYAPYDSRAAYAENLMRRRPQSSFEAILNQRHGTFGAYDVEEEMVKRSDSSSSRRDETGSDEEVAAIHYQQEMARRAVAGRFDTSGSVSDEYYYFGVIQLPQEKIQSILYKATPPPGYFHLPPIEKAAYLFYFVLYNRYFTPIEEFHNRFNREFFKYSCDGDSAETALWKICKHTQEEFVARRSAYQLKAYEKTQKQLFSDDRETPDSRLSDHGSRYDQEEDSDRLSIESASKEPYKFRSAHAFARFAVGGKVIVVDPEASTSVIELRDLKSFVAETETQRIIETIEMFHGPLIPGMTPPHSVSLYIERQIDHIMKSDIYKANPLGSDASDCLLVWQLLKMIVQQQGRVTGPDISRLLMTGYDDKSIPGGHSAVSIHNSDEVNGFHRYMQFLLGGHVDEAIESAIKDGLILDAMVLARWVCPQKLEKVDAAFLAQRAEQNPVMTLLSVAHDFPAPILLNPPTDDTGSWRSHAAIILANLATETAFKMVYNLGKVLARREYHAAADFCFLAVSLLADYDPFCPVVHSDEDDTQGRQHITLVHASLPDDEVESVNCCYGFSIVDLHATEIYEYGLRLACTGFPVRLTQSCDYQKYRFKYAQLLSEYGGFASDAYRYCVEIAKGVTEKWADYGQDEMLQLCDLADRLQHVACADRKEISWFSEVRGFIEHSNTAPLVQDTGLQQASFADCSKENPTDVSATQPRTRTLSFGSEAAEWHADHQEPLQMSPITSNVENATLLEQQSHDTGQRSQTHKTEACTMHEMQQHHILAQRRTSAINTGSSTLNPSQQLIAFPPPLPTTQESLDTLEDKVRGLSLNEQKAGEQQVENYGQYDSGSEIHNEASEKTAIRAERLTMRPQLFITEIESSNDASSANSSSQENTPLKQNEFKHSTEMSTVLDAPSPSGMDDSVFTAGDDPTHYQTAQTPEIASHRNLNHRTDVHTPLCNTNDDFNIISTEQAYSSLKTDQNKLTKPAETSKSLSGSSHSSGIFGMLKAKIAKAIPSGNEMILPDDKNPSIVWDPVQNKYVGAGVEEEKVDSKPPSAANSALLDGSGKNSNVGLTAARLSGGSRYFNPLNDIASQSSSVSPAPTMPPVMVPPTFGFIPTPPDDDNATPESPFSVDTSPVIPSTTTLT